MVAKLNFIKKDKINKEKENKNSKELGIKSQNTLKVIQLYD